jgi:hypothetical protein
MVYSLLGSLLVKDCNVSWSTLERTWAIYFTDVKIPATNRFSKCENCERLKKMLHTRNVEVGHDLREKVFENLRHDKLDKNIL